jgi:hypothetical protein
VKSFDIDFVRRPAPRWLGPFVLAGSVVAFAASWNHFTERRDLARAQVAARHQAEQQALRPAAPRAEDVKRQEQDTQERAALAYQWKGIFDALEAVGGADVKVVSFTHDRASGKSQVVLEAPSYNSIDAALTRMKKASPANAQWSIESISREQTGGASVVRANVAGSR